jgi:hypothetical protein
MLNVREHSIKVQREQDQQILDKVITHIMPNEEWVVKEIQKEKTAMDHFNLVQRAYREKYPGKRNQRKVMVKLELLKEQMIQEFVTDLVSRQHVAITLMNSLVKVNIPLFIPLKDYSKNKIILLNSIKKYVGYSDDMEYSFFNKIGVMKFFSKIAREFYLDTGKYPYTITKR